MFKWLKELFTSTDNDLPTSTLEPLLGYVADIHGVNNTQESKADLNKMTKAELETYAKENFSVNIDTRKKKADLVAEVENLTK